MDQRPPRIRVMADPASSLIDLTLGHLARLDLLLRREVLRQRLLRPKPPDDEFRGLYISEDDVERLLTDSRAAVSLLAPTLPPNDGLGALDDAIASLTSCLREQETAPRDTSEL